ncbi:MAG: hypothetical protein P9M14_05095 [Candidatus Alcyoniella australis]|nr:hypothetical protein [Candidatus Alcyoniella australis]
MRDADRVYLGERFCALRYRNRLAEFVAAAQHSAAPCWLCTPSLVRQSELERIAELTLDAAQAFAGVLVGDLGLGRLLAGRVRLGYGGYIGNLPTGQTIVERIGAELLRVFPPTIRTVETLAAQLPVEVVVHGRLPLATTPRCLTRLHLGCEQCEQRLEVEGYPAAIELRGNTLYSSRPVQAYGIIERLKNAGVQWAVIEGLGVDQEQYQGLAEVYDGQRPAPSRLTSGLFFRSQASGIDSPAWVELLDPAAQDARP